ncbi:testican-2-like [Micropterus dolomieu]|uniref:testican-2-like n=1 Tax=Micropterus dolomieu TaxID=147949 RepID=UPI001E8EE6FB|nr:testican-2-like [Micropterus dolomieu]
MVAGLMLGLQQQQSFQSMQQHSSEMYNSQEASMSTDFESPDATKDPCLKVRCPPHKVCVSHDYQTAICTNHKQPTHSVKPRKGSVGHKHSLEAGVHGKCRLCSALQSSPVCGSDGHTYSSKSHFTIYVLTPVLLHCVMQMTENMVSYSRFFKQLKIISRRFGKALQPPSSHLTLATFVISEQRTISLRS